MGAIAAGAGEHQMASEELDFRRLRFKSPEFLDRKWLEWFREEFGRHIFGIDIAPDPDAPFGLEGTFRALPEFAVYTGSCSPMVSQSTKNYGTDGTVGITVALAGDMMARSGGRDIALKPGAGIFGAGEAQVAVDFRSHARVMTLTLSRRLLASLMPNVGYFITTPIPADLQAMRLLLRYLGALDAEDTIASPELRHVIAASVHDLVALALGAGREAGQLAGQRGVRAARLAAIKQDILSNISDPRLSVGTVAERQGLTPRYIHLLFEAAGVSFTEYVIDLRLADAHRRLGDQRFLHQPISAIAMQVGFGDLSYFNRTFRRRYGVTPSDVREQARSNGGW